MCVHITQDILYIPVFVFKTFYYFNFEHTTDVKDNLLNVPAFGITETVRGNNTFNYFSSKIDQIWNKNFRSSLRANVGLVDIERQGGGLEGGAAFPSSANTQKRNSVLLALKNSSIVSLTANSFLPSGELRNAFAAFLSCAFS